MTRKRVAESIATCAGCGQYRTCQLYKGLWLCLHGPGHCHMRRKVIHALKGGKSKGLEVTDESSSSPSPSSKHHRRRLGNTG